ncbi:Uncharacterised protein [Vibrio cholerae]|nr:Uncharacterised protein [Vibrio cholerae]
MPDGFQHRINLQNSPQCKGYALGDSLRSA